MKIPRPLRAFLGSARAGDKTAVQPPPTPAPPLDEAAPQVDPAVQAIIDSGVFDLGWFEAQTGCRFPDVQVGVEAYLAQGKARRFSLHPLFEPELTDPQWNKRDDDPLLHFLSTGDFRAHPLFQDAKLDQSSGEHQGQRWLRWVQHAQADTTVPGQTHTWGQVRGAMLAAVSEWRRDDALAMGTRWVSRVSLLPDPPGDGPEADTSPGDETAGVPTSAVEEPEPGPTSAEAPTAAPAPAEVALVSVVVTTGDDVDALQRTIESVLAQSRDALEVLLVVDPGSSQLFGEAARMAGGDSRVQVIGHPWHDLTTARKQGLAEATGDYLAVVEAGVRWSPHHLHHVVSAMQTTGWKLAHGVVKQAGVPRYRAFSGSYEHLLRGNYIDLAALVVSRDLLERSGGLPAEADDPDTATVLHLARLEQPHLVRVLSLERDVVEADRRAQLREHEVVGRYLLDTGRDRRPVPGRRSVIVPARHYNRVLARLAALADDDLEVVVVGIRTRVQRCLAAGALAGWPVRLVGYSDTDNWALLANLGVAASTGTTVVLTRQSATLTREVIDRLTVVLDEPGVAISQPLCSYPDDTVAGLGAGFPDQQSRRRVVTPFPLFDGYAASLLPPGGPLRVPAALGEVVAARRDDVLAVGGLAARFGNDLAETDLSLRLGAAGMGSTVSLPDVRLTVAPGERFGFSPDLATSAEALDAAHPEVPDGTRNLLDEAGLQITGWALERLPGGVEQQRPQWSMRPRLAHGHKLNVSQGLPSLWWTLDTASPAGPVGDQWGDTHFAESLAAALRRLGQTVSIDRREARGRATRPDDDVTLVMRGLHRVDPLPTQINVLWLISHPQDVTADELVDYDLLYAASIPWAERRSTEWGLQIRPMLQCTDPQLFNPSRAEPGSGPDVVWVGKSRGIHRPMLRMALASGADVAIYGTGWKPFLDESRVIAEYLDNDLVGELYAGAGVVLNDHWDDMRRDGFLSNRLFDAVACGSRVISDDVEGMAELFDGSVLSVEDQAEVDRILTGRLDDWFPDRQTRLATAARMAAEHSFDARARTLVESVARRRTELGLD